ncbi:MAG TPA: hypothetical protein VNO55_24610 [Polyangia bacterium]|nr:hypothetical protein [Polyangia bacterium]
MAVHKPGKSFVEMFDLIYSNNFVRADFPDRLLIGIFWEESLFNNVYQIGGGTGIGFGQVEPAEFHRMAEFNLTVPPTKKVGHQTKSTRPLSDEEAVQAACALLGSLKNILGTQRGALLGYAGYEWAKRTPGAYPSAAQRLNIIAGWKACEAKLLDVRPFRLPERSEQDVILGALNSAKPFGALRETFRPLLFRADDYA